MNVLGRLSIPRKLTFIIMATTFAALLLAAGGFVTHEILTFRSSMVQEMTSLAEIVGANSTAALSFNNEEEAAEILNTLRTEPNIVAGAVYGPEGNLFASYSSVDQGQSAVVPARVPGPGHRFHSTFYFQTLPIVLQGERIGSIYSSVRHPAPRRPPAEIPGDHGAGPERRRRLRLLGLLPPAAGRVPADSQPRPHHARHLPQQGLRRPRDPHERGRDRRADGRLQRDARGDHGSRSGAERDPRGPGTARDRAEAGDRGAAPGGAEPGPDGRHPGSDHRRGGHRRRRRTDPLRQPGGTAAAGAPARARAAAHAPDRPGAGSRGAAPPGWRAGRSGPRRRLERGVVLPRRAGPGRRVLPGGAGPPDFGRGGGVLFHDRPRHHRPARGRAGPGPGAGLAGRQGRDPDPGADAGQRRAGQGRPPQGRVPGQHESRTPHSAEHRSRPGRIAAGGDLRPGQRTPGAVASEPGRERPAPALADQRHSRPLQGRGRHGRAGDGSRSTCPKSAGPA